MRYRFCRPRGIRGDVSALARAHDARVIRIRIPGYVPIPRTSGYGYSLHLGSFVFWLLVQPLEPGRCAPRKPEMADTQTKTRLVAKVLRELVTVEQFVSHKDVQDALESRLKALRIGVEQHEFDDALSLVGSNQHLVSAASGWFVTKGSRSDDDVAAKEIWPPITPREARALLDSLGVRVSGMRLAPVRHFPESPDRPEYFPDLVMVRE